MSRYTRMIFMAVSAVCGGICSASVKLPRHEHARRQPIHHKPNRYTIKLPARNATSIFAVVLDLLNRQNIATISSDIPAASIKCPNCMFRIGSRRRNNSALSNALHTFAAPAIEKITPALTQNQFFAVRILQSICMEERRTIARPYQLQIYPAIFCICNVSVSIPLQSINTSSQ